MPLLRAPPPRHHPGVLAAIRKLPCQLARWAGPKGGRGRRVGGASGVRRGGGPFCSGGGRGLEVGGVNEWVGPVSGRGLKVGVATMGGASRRGRGHRRWRIQGLVTGWASPREVGGACITLKGDGRVPCNHTPLPTAAYAHVRLQPRPFVGVSHSDPAPCCLLMAHALFFSPAPLWAWTFLTPPPHLLPLL